MKIFHLDISKWNRTGLLDKAPSQLEKLQLAQKLEDEEQIEKLLNTLPKVVSNEM